MTPRFRAAVVQAAAAGFGGQVLRDSGVRSCNTTLRPIFHFVLLVLRGLRPD